MSGEASAIFKATATIGNPAAKIGTAAELSGSPLIWADPLTIAAIPAHSFREFAGPYGRCWRIERVLG